MAERKTTKGNSLEYQGPTSEQGYTTSSLPPNPSDAIFLGSPLPILPAEAVTLRRPFSEPTRNPLHYSDGPGTDEGVTSRRPAYPAPTGNVHSELDHTELRPIQGTNKQPYSRGPNVDKTLNGADIYGT